MEDNICVFKLMRKHHGKNSVQNKEHYIKVLGLFLILDDLNINMFS